MTTARIALLASFLCIGLAACGSDTSPLGPEPMANAPDSSLDVGPNASEAQLQQDLPFQRILCFGDSLTIGITSRRAFQHFTLEPVEGYIPKLKRLLKNEFGDAPQLFNSGRGAETTDRGLERLRIEIRSRQFDLVLLLEGVVDVNNPSPKFARARANLKEMMRVVKAEGIPVIIGTVPPLNSDGFRIRGIKNIPKLNDIIREEAAAERVPVADHDEAFGGDLGFQGPDGLHPNNSGYQLMAETWFEVILDLVAEMET